MSRSGFSVYEFTTNGFRATLDNIRLVVLSILTCFSGLIVAGIGSALIISPTLLKLRPLFESLKPTLNQPGVIVDKAAQAKMAAEVWSRIQPAITMVDIALGVLSILFFIAVMLSLVTGFFRVSLDIAQQGSSSVSRMFSCLKYAPRLLVAFLISIVIVFLGFLAFIIPGIILTLRLRFFIFYIFDRDMGAVQAIKASYKETKGLEWEILGLNIVAAVLAIAVPVIGIPVTFFVFSYAYKALPRSI